MFKTFPEFSKLTLEDREEYEGYIKDFPPIADLSFPSIMTWWNSLGQAAVSVLNGNLVVSYWIPGFEPDSGLCLVGTNKVDESFCTIFDHLVSRGERPRLVCLPDFVVSHVRYPALFHFEDMRAEYEYVVSAAKFANLDKTVSWKSRKIQSQLQKLKGISMEVRPLDFDDKAERQMFFEATEKWWNKNINNLGAIERDAMMMAVRNIKELGLESIGLFIEGHLRGFCIYRRPPDKTYVTIHFIKATGNKMLGFELIGHLFAKQFAERGAEYVNINTDAGDLRLRMFMLTLGPINFFRKYSVEPS